MKNIYLDYNATTPLHEEVKKAMINAMECFGNPSSNHIYGKSAKKIIDQARQSIAEAVNAEPEEIIFTSGGTESNNYAIKGYMYANQDKGNHIITSQIEHPAVINVCRQLENEGFEVTYLPVNNDGFVSIESIDKAVKENTALITIMHANNETGAIQPIKEISQIAKENNICFHSDAAQSLGKIPVDVKAMGVSTLSVAGHKIYAPKGIGAIYVKNGIFLKNLLNGAGHENGKRPGTENTVHIAGLGKACEMISQELSKNSHHYRFYRDMLVTLLQKQNLDFRINSMPDKALPNTASISFKGIQAAKLIDLIPEISVSAGSACHSNSTEISSVLKAMNIPFNYAMGTIRFSVGLYTSEEDIIYTVRKVSESISYLKHQQ